MILQRLSEYYDRLATDPAAASSLPKSGYSLQKVSFCVVLNSDGTVQQFQSLLDEGKKNPVPRQLLVPGQSKPTGQGINPCFLWDNAAYMLGFKLDDAKPARTRESFEAFRSRHLSAENEINSPTLRAVCAFLRTWSPESVGAWTAELREITSSFGVFRVAGEQRFSHEDPAVIQYWSARATAGANSALGFSLITGQLDHVARLHEPKIKGVRGAQTSGALLVSFNDNAYTSFGKEQGSNAPVSIGEAFKYANALNHLLLPTSHKLVLGDTTWVFWAERPTTFEDFVSDLLGDFAWPVVEPVVEDRRRVEQVRLFLSQLREGFAGERAFDPEDHTRFFILGLAPNASRIAVRFWADTTVGEMKACLAQHARDVELNGARDDDAPLMIRRIVEATGRAKLGPKGQLVYDAKAVQPLLAGVIARAVLTGGPYPQMLLSAMLNRMRADGAITHVRVAAIKAYLVRNSRLQRRPKEVPVALDTDRIDSGYVTGRIFALLEKIQEASTEGDLNATIKDRYFSSASATPIMVFPRLICLSQHHLAKMKVGEKIYYEKQLGEAMNKLNCFASHFGLEDQGLFVVGYYHQRQDLYTSKKDKKGENV